MSQPLRILVIEAITAGFFGFRQCEPTQISVDDPNRDMTRSDQPRDSGPSPQLFAEGDGMLRAILTDLDCAANPITIESREDVRRKRETQYQETQYQVTTIRSQHFPSLVPCSAEVILVECQSQLDQAIVSASATADKVMLIAPEPDGILESILRSIPSESLNGRGDSSTERLRTKLVSPQLDFVKIAADKWETFQVLKQANCPVVPHFELDHPFDRHQFPLVVKPRLGCGSEGISVVSEIDKWTAKRKQFSTKTFDSPTNLGNDYWIATEFKQGQHISIAALCGGHHFQWLPACLQSLKIDQSNDHTIEYLGGTITQNYPINRRAQTLAQKALLAMPPTVGYVGLDLILGTDGKDYVVEINPRLTTSIVGIRKACPRENIAIQMIQQSLQPVNQTIVADHEVSFHIGEREHGARIVVN